MSQAQYLIGNQWPERVSTSLSAIARYYEIDMNPSHMLSSHNLVEDLPRVLTALSEMAYPTLQDSPQPMRAGFGSNLPQWLSPSELEPTGSVPVIALNIMTRIGQGTGMPFGGVVFEDPLWAIIAAGNIGYGHNRKAIPLASDARVMWAVTGKVLADLDDKSYIASNYFSDFAYYIGHEDRACFSILLVDSHRIMQLRSIGRCLIPHVPVGKIFQLYTNPDYETRMLGK